MIGRKVYQRPLMVSSSLGTTPWAMKTVDATPLVTIPVTWICGVARTTPFSAVTRRMIFSVSSLENMYFSGSSLPFSCQPARLIRRLPSPSPRTAMNFNPLYTSWI